MHSYLLVFTFFLVVTAPILRIDAKPTPQLNELPGLYSLNIHFVSPIYRGSCTFGEFWYPKEIQCAICTCLVNGFSRCIPRLACVPVDSSGAMRPSSTSTVGTTTRWPTPSSTMTATIPTTPRTAVVNNKIFSTAVPEIISSQLAAEGTTSATADSSATKIDLAYNDLTTMAAAIDMNTNVDETTTTRTPPEMLEIQKEGNIPGNIPEILSADQLIFGDPDESTTSSYEATTTVDYDNYYNSDDFD